MGSQARPLTKLWCCVSVLSCRPLTASQTIRVLSTLQVTRVRLLGAQVRSETLLLWPRKVLMCFQFSRLGCSELPKAVVAGPGRISYKHARPSSEPVAKYLLSWENLAAVTACKCSLKVASRRGAALASTLASKMAARFHILAVWSAPPVARRLPLELMSTENMDLPTGLLRYCQCCVLLRSALYKLVVT